MAHRIRRSRETGEYNFVEFVADSAALVVTAWHRLGKACRRTKEDGSAVTVKDALRMIEADYEVEKRPTYRARILADGSTEVVQSRLAYVTVRTDTDEELGRVGPDYTPLQNEDAFAAAEPLIDSGVLLLETGGVLRQGADVWLCGQWNLDKFGPIVREVFADELVPFAFFGNNHSGRRNATVADATIRPVCANTVGVVERDIDSGRCRSVSVRHNGDARQKMIEASEELFGGVIERFETIAAQYRALKSVKLTDAQFEELITRPALGLHPTERPAFNPEAKMAEVVVARWEKRRDEVKRLWHEGKGHSGDDSAWEAYNGLVEAVDHNVDLFPTRSGVYRTQSLLAGNLRNMKDAALAHCVAFAQGAPASDAEAVDDLLASL